MSTERGYLNDPFRLEFTANVVGQVELPAGRKGILLNHTFFYPTGGGQDHDTGLLGPARVVDVLNDEQGNILHVIEGEIADKTVTGKIDAERRLSFMEHHTAQHLLSAVVEQLLHLETLSAHISIDSPTTIDTPVSAIQDADMLRVEDLANSIIRQDLPVKSYIVTDAQVATIPFRRPPKVSGEIRVVEIAGVDYSACGGTHCTRTGMMGVLKVLRAERRGDRTRLYMVAGKRALELFQNYYAIVLKTALAMNTGPENVVEGIAHQTEALNAAQKELEKLQGEKLAWEAKQRVSEAETVDSVRLVTAAYRDRTPQQIRALAMLLQNEPGVVALLAAYDGARLTLTVTAAADTGIRANELIRKQLAEIAGRGGGDARVAQGGGAATEEQFNGLFGKTRDYVRESIQRQAN